MNWKWQADYLNTQPASHSNDLSFMQAGSEPRSSQLHLEATGMWRSRHARDTSGQHLAPVWCSVLAVCRCCRRGCATGSIRHTTPHPSMVQPLVRHHTRSCHLAMHSFQAVTRFWRSPLEWTERLLIKAGPRLSPGTFGLWFSSRSFRFLTGDNPQGIPCLCILTNTRWDEVACVYMPLHLILCCLLVNVLQCMKVEIFWHILAITTTTT